VQRRQWRLRVDDMLEGIANIRAYVAGMTYEQFLSDRKTVDAVIRNLEIIGEAGAQLEDAIESRYPEVPWADVRDMRNLLVHRYFGVDLAIVWQTVEHDLQPLDKALQAILQRESDSVG
jgi:uncharacterized protein with HEPN domain